MPSMSMPVLFPRDRFAVYLYYIPREEEIDKQTGVRALLSCLRKAAQTLSSPNGRDVSKRAAAAVAAGV